MRAFASDNYAPILPEALDAIAAVNDGHAVSYGADESTARLQTVIRATSATTPPPSRCSTARARTSSGCARCCGRGRAWSAPRARTSTSTRAARPRRMAGIKLLTAPTPDGKLTPELVDRWLVRIGDEHAVQPGRRQRHAVHRARHAVLLDELRALAEHAHANGMLFHVDGSRLANAAAALDVGLGDTAGVGPTSSASAVPRSACSRPRPWSSATRSSPPSLLYLRKQSMQLASKMRFVWHSCSRCSRATCGAARRVTPTRWRRGWPPAWGTR